MASRAGLDRAAVIDAAAAMVDAAGREITLADLAARLGVRPPSLYNHIAGQEGLRHELALLGLRELAARLGRATIGKAADEALLALAHAYRAFARERPGLYAATLRAPGSAAEELIAADILAVLRAVLQAYDLDDEETVHTMRGMRSVLHGFVSLEVIGGFGLPIDLDQSFTHLVRVFIGGLPRRDGGGPRAESPRR